MARPRKVVSLRTGQMSKTEKAARAAGEKQIKVKTDAMKPPEWLSDEAALTFERIVNEFDPLGMLDNLDVDILAVYADSLATYRKASIQLALHGETYETKNGFATVSPWVTVRQKAYQQIASCSTKLGIALTDRLKLIAPVKEEKSANKYIKFLDNGAAAGGST